MSPKVSVIMGVYNCATTIKESIDSILNQTYTNWELIVCDDCSTDQTYSIIEDIRNQNPDKIVLLKNELNLGLAATLNHCLKYATGDYIARQDGDDLSMLNRFETQVDFLLNHSEYDLVGSKMTSFDEQGIINIRGVEDSIPDKYTFLKSNPFCHATIMARKEVFQHLDGYRVIKKTYRTEDLDLWYRFFEKNFRGYNLSESLYFVRDDRHAYRRRNVQNYINVFLVSVEGYRRLKIPQKYYPFLLKPLLTILIPQSLIKKYHERKYSSNLID